eukprot:XP_001189480.3 PREDICTED: uncharacterized protein LOC755341 [Strongylocentrotus purpuratus]
MKRENDRLVDEDSRDNCDQQHEESVEALNNHDNVNEDDSIDIVSEVNKEAQFVGENGNDEENVGQMKGDQDAEILDNDDDDDDVGDSISVNGSPRDAGRYENDDSYKNTDLTATVKTGDKKVESKEGNRRSSMKSAKSTKKSKTVRVKSSKTVSSIEVDMTRIIRNEDDDDFDADEDDDAVTRVTCGKSVDFSIPVDELDEELQRVIDRPGSGRTSMMDNEDMIGLGRAATMNTPVTIDDRESYVYPTKYSNGNHVMACPSMQSISSISGWRSVPMFNLPNVVKHINKTPFNDQPNSYFYISQSKPVPLKPMKVWKGYRGNVYFEPMVCRRAPFSSASSNPKPNERVASSHLPVIPKSAEITTNGAPANPAHFNSHSATTSRSQPPNGRRTAASGAKSATSTRSSGRQLAILDKTTVLSRMDYNAAEDIKWISGIESTGTLQIGPSGDKLAGRAYKVYRNGPKHPKLRIRRGLVSHNLAGNNKNSPKFGVSGGRINEDLTTNRNANPTNRTQKRNSVQEHHGVSQSYPSDNYCCVDSMTPLQQIMKRNDGHGRSKLVHILPSAYGDGGIGSIRPKGK